MSNEFDATDRIDINIILSPWKEDEINKMCTFSRPGEVISGYGAAGAKMR